MNVAGFKHNLIEYNDMMTHMDANFKMYFNSYLIANYGINEQTFRNVIKTLAPEDFI